MKRADWIAAAAIVVALAGTWLNVRRYQGAPLPSPSPDCIEGVLDPRGVVAKVCGEIPPMAPPDAEPLEPTKPPVIPAVEWGPCSEPGVLSSRQRAEDAWLREVLASKRDYPTWGVPEWAAQAASCAAYRDRIAWWPR
jgi:hypothetical protein